MRRILLSTACALSLGLGALPAFADSVTAADEAETTASADKDVQTVIVTARKRSERLQDVPISIGVISAADVESKNIVDIDRVATLTPGLTFDVGLLPTDTRIAIRGLQAVRGRPNVAILVDGIDTSSENFGVAGGGILANLRLVDVERIEVVKGPQNVLYGRSAFAGAVNYITKRPSRSFEAKVSAELGTFGMYQLKGSVSGPIAGDKLFARLNLNAYNTDGDYKNGATGGQLNAAESFGGALGLMYEPSSNLNIYLRLQYAKEKYAERAQVLLRSVDAQTGLVNTADGGFLAPDRRPNAPFPITAYSIRGDVSKASNYLNRNINISPDPNNPGKDYPGSDIKTFRGSLNIDWETSFGDFQFLTGFVDNKSVFNQDFDNTNYSLLPNTGIAGYAAGGPFSTLSIFRNQFGWPLPFLPAYGLSGEFDASVNIKQVSQEARWTKDFGRVRATLDALYWHEDAEYKDRSLFWLRSGGNTTLGAFISFAQGGTGFHLGSPSVTSGTPQRITRETDSVSLAAAFEVEITETLTANIEARYIKDEIVYTGLNFDPFLVNTYGRRPGGFNRTNPPVENEKFTPRVNLSWKAMDNLLTYATYAKGTKPGGIDTTDQNGNVNDGRFLPENVTTYEVGAKYNTADGRLILNGAYFFNVYKDQQIGIIETIAGIPQSRTVNIGESETKGIELETSWAINANWFLRAGYTYTDAKFTDYILPRCGAIDSAETQTPNCNFTGKTAPQTPEHKLTFGARFEQPLSTGGLVSAEFDTRYESLRYISTSNLAWFPEYWQTDASLAYEGEKWTVAFSVQNLFNDKTPRTGTSSVDYGYFDLNSNQLPRGVLVAMPPKRSGVLKVSYKY